MRVLRGTAEIGGTCVEIKAQGARLLLDLGLPPDGDPDDAAVPSLDGSGDLLALVLSHTEKRYTTEVSGLPTSIKWSRSLTSARRRNR